jgi:hypothetical protein
MRAVIKLLLLLMLSLLFVRLADVHDGVQCPFPLSDLWPTNAWQLCKPVTWGKK